MWIVYYVFQRMPLPFRKSLLHTKCRRKQEYWILVQAFDRQIVWCQPFIFILTQRRLTSIEPARKICQPIENIEVQKKRTFPVDKTSTGFAIHSYLIKNNNNNNQLMYKRLYYMECTLGSAPCCTAQCVFIAWHSVWNSTKLHHIVQNWAKKSELYE